jgi:polyhydroxyalkanoate synthesis regulator phasin
MSPEPRFSLEELVELQRRERAARGETEADTTRHLRERLQRLRAEQGPEPVTPAEKPAEPERPGLTSRVTALEEEVKRLRDRIEGKNG